MTRLLLPFAAALFAAGAIVGAFQLVFADQDIRVSQNVFVNPPSVVDASNTPSLAVNPASPQNLVVVNRVDRPGFSALLHWTKNGGGSWRSTNLPVPEDQERCAAPHPSGRQCPFAPDLAFTRDGTLFVSYVNLGGEGNIPHSLWVARSDDGGETLSAPVRVAGRLTFQPRIAVDLDGTLHLTWLQAGEVGLLRLAGPARIVAARSEDGGRTFSDPAPVSDPERQRVGAATPVVDSGGSLVVLYEDFGDDRRDFENLEGPVHEGSFALVLTRADRGAFSPGVEVETRIVPTRRFLVFLPGFPSIAAGPNRTLYAAWSDGRNGDEDVLLRRSTDGGSTWSAPGRVNDNRLRDGTDQYLPHLTVAPEGRVDVVFFDRRRDPRNVMTDAFLATSQDQGRRFRNLRISSQAFDSRVGPLVGPPWLEPDLGSRLGLASRDEATFAAWTDTRQGTEATGRQDIALARVDVPSLEGVGARRIIVIVLLVAAAGSLIAWRRRAGGPPGALEPSGKRVEDGVR